MSSTRYEATRDAIETTLNAVEGIGKVYKSPRYAADWEEWIKLHVTRENLVKVCWFSLGSGSETIDTQLAEFDAADEINYTERRETWTIELFYGFKDSDTEPSDFEFQLLAERIEEAFRFLQNLGMDATLAASVYQSLPLERTFSGLFNLGNVVLCHRASFNLTVIHRIQNTN